MEMPASGGCKSLDLSIARWLQIDTTGGSSANVQSDLRFTFLPAPGTNRPALASPAEAN